MNSPMLDEFIGTAGGRGRRSGKIPRETYMDLANRVFFCLLSAAKTSCTLL